MRAFAQAPSAEPSTPGNGSTFSLGVLAAMLVCAAVYLGIGAPAASAAPEAQPGWSLQSSFGSFGLGRYDASSSPIVVDGSGNVLVVEQEQIAVRIFSSSGDLLTSFSNGLPRNIAVDTTDDAVYLDEISLFGGSTITRWVSNGEPTPTYTQDPAFAAIPQGEGIAVDPTSHDVFVADPGAEAVRRYDSTGAPVGTIATPSISPSWIVFAPDGTLYVASGGGPDITHLSDTGTVLGTISGVGSLQGLTFDPVNEVLVAAVGDKLRTYSSAGAFISDSPGKSGTGLGSGDGRLLELADGTVNVYVKATIPGVEAPVVTDVQPSSVHVSAEVDPGAGPPEGSAAFFEYSANGGQSWKETPAESVERTGSEGPDTIEANLEGLILNTEYLVRVKAFNSLASNTSAATSFGTPEIAPVVETGLASDFAETSAILHGTVNPAGQQTGYHFEYGTTTAYGNRVPLGAESPAGNRRVPRDVSKLITGLAPGTTYHYRLVAENSVGTTNGADRTFKTLEPSELFPQRAYEQVTPVDKRGAAVLSDFHVQTAADGSAIAVTTVGASEDAESSLILQNYLSRRGSSDWLDWTQIDPPQDAMPGLNESATTAVSADFEHALVISNRALAPGGIARGGNLYVKDFATGAYTFVAGVPGIDAWNLLVGIQANERVFLAAAPDFSWILFWGQPSFLPEASATAIYKWTRATGELKVESRLPDETVAPFPVQTADGYKRELPSASTDGNVLAFSAGGVFRREDGQTMALSVSRVTGDPNDEPQPATFDGMTPDGRYVFFHGAIQLTDDTPPVSFASDYLYRYDAATDELRYLSPTVSGTTVGVYGFSPDGQRIYFDDSSRTVVWDDGTVREVTATRPVSLFSGSETSISASGRYFAWVDEDRNIHLYDAELDESSCVSCPVDGSLGGKARMMAIGRGIGNREVNAVLDDGTVFFDSPTRLLAADHNGTRDVYAYKNGRLDLISPGSEDSAAFFVDASEDGSSVFFQTTQGLVGQDTDGNPDVYVARVGGGFASQYPPPPSGSCQGAECAWASGKPAAAPPVATGGAADPATPQKKYKKKHKKHRKHKQGRKHKHKGSGHQNKARGN